MLLPGYKRLLTLCSFLFVLPLAARCQDMAAIKLQLESIHASDQVYRIRLDSLVRQAHKDWKSEEVQAILPLAARQDSMNLAFVLDVLARYGWPGIQEVDTAANEAVFLVIRHADSAVMRSVFPLLVQSYETGGTPAKYYAMMLDRLLTESGQKQVYGTQISFEKKDGAYAPFPIIQEALVDERRRRVGLPPLKTSMQQWK